MKSAISAEEFQRFQTQLLSLREAQITANEAKLNAERKVKFLEEEITRLRTSLNDAQSIVNLPELEELRRENELLRDKLLNTESSFQLQASTLRSECQRLTMELDQLKIISSNELVVTRECQTLAKLFDHSFVQTDTAQDSSSTGVNEYVEKLEYSLDLANTMLSQLTLTVESLQFKVDGLEADLHFKLLAYQNSNSDLKNENSSLKLSLSQLREKLSSSIENEHSMKNQLEAVKRRSEKLNREFRRQLIRFMRSNPNDVESSSLCKTSLHSSISSLSSNLNSNDEMCAESNHTGIIHSINSQNVQPAHNSNQFEDMPSGFFSTADFKTLVDRMTYVQEENYTLRKANQRLEADLKAKSYVIQSELNRRLTAMPMSNVANTLTTTVSTNPTTNVKTLGLSPLSWFPFSTKTHNAGSNQSAELSSINVQTVNRLKLMCEQLLTQNIQLTEKLHELQGSRNKPAPIQPTV